MTANPDEKVGIEFARTSNVVTFWRATCSSGHHSIATSERAAPLLSAVVPTFNESSNVPIVIERVVAQLARADWEIIFVDDDSPDATSTVAKRLGELDGRVRGVELYELADRHRHVKIDLVGRGHDDGAAGSPRRRNRSCLANQVQSGARRFSTALMLSRAP